MKSSTTSEAVRKPKSRVAIASLSAVLVALVVIFTVVSVRGAKRGSSTAGSQGIGVVSRENLTQRVTISGQIFPKHRLDVKPPFNGYVAKLFVKIGDRVHAHDPIVTFSPSLAGVETNFPVRTPFDGVVTQILKTEGEYVTETGEQNLVARVEDVSDLYITATVPELDIAKIKIGEEAVIRISALVGETFAGEISEISLSAKDKNSWSSASTEFQVKIKLKSHDPRLLSGMSAVMDVIAAKRENALALPHEFIQDSDDGTFFVTMENGEKRTVKLGLQTAEAAEIVSGLRQGDRVRPIDFLTLPKLDD